MQQATANSFFFQISAFAKRLYKIYFKQVIYLINLMGFSHYSILVVL